jgi:hypothetical protein
LGIGLHDSVVLVDHVDESVTVGLARVVCLKGNLETLAGDPERLALLVAATLDLGQRRTPPALLLGEGRRSEVDRELARYPLGEPQKGRAQYQQGKR